MLTRTVIATLLTCTLSAADLTAGDPVPTFSGPTTITNVYAPFEVGTVKVFHGRSAGERTTTVIAHAEDTRTFVFDGEEVVCCILQEKEFTAGALVEITTHYLAQDDAGNVRAFGEVSIEIEAGVVIGAEEDSWILGGATLPTDPAGVYNAETPQMYMPANPQLGDVFDQEAFPHSSESLTVVGVGNKVKVPSGKYGWSLKLKETGEEEEDDDDGPEYRWIVPGVGEVKSKSSKSKSRLFDTSLLQTDLGG